MNQAGFSQRGVDMKIVHQVMRESGEVGQIAIDYLQWAAREAAGTLDKEEAAKQPISFEEMGTRLREALRILQHGTEVQPSGETKETST
jgi:hypothetical protein